GVERLKGGPDLAERLRRTGRGRLHPGQPVERTDAFLLAVPGGAELLPRLLHPFRTGAQRLLDRAPLRLLRLGDLQFGLQECDLAVHMPAGERAMPAAARPEAVGVGTGEAAGTGHEAENDRGNLVDALHRIPPSVVD